MFEIIFQILPPTQFILSHKCNLTILIGRCSAALYEEQLWLSNKERAVFVLKNVDDVTNMDRVATGSFHITILSVSHEEHHQTLVLLQEAVLSNIIQNCSAFLIIMFHRK